MQSVSPVESEKKARTAREAALAYRPQAAPLPVSVAWPVDNEPYRLAALQYFEAAQGFYQSGDHQRGDYCILRGDMYLLLASVAMQVNAAGVSPLLDAKPAEKATAKDRPIGKELEAKLQQLKELLAREGPTVPRVPAEAANADTCDYFHDMSLGCVDEAILASDAGNNAGVDYWMHESLLYDICYDICEEKIHKFDS